MKGEDRRFIHTFGANGDFSAGDVPCELLATCKVLYVGGYLALPGMRQEELALLFRSARERGVKTVLDVVVPGPGEYVSRFESLLPHTDVFLPNHDEAILITGETDARRQADVFCRLGAGTTIMVQLSRAT